MGGASPCTIAYLVNGEAMEFDKDDWMIESLKRYGQLFMFELQSAASCLEWEGGRGGVYVSGEAGNGSSELALLSLPEKLSTSQDENLAARRDFSIVCGVISPHSVCSLRHLPPHQMVAAADGTQVHLWRRETSGSDLLVEAGVLVHHEEGKDATLISGYPPQHYTDWSSGAQDYLLSGCSHSAPHVKLLNLSSGKTLWQVDVGGRGRGGGSLVLHGTVYAGDDAHSILTCAGEGGDLTLWDTREPTRPGDSSNSTANNTYVYSLAVSPRTRQAATLSSRGSIAVYDLRSLQQPIVMVTTPTTTSAGQLALATRRPHIQFSPLLPQLLSISGVNRGVSVYNTALWTGQNEAVPTPLFTHDGHEELSPERVHLLCHLWHHTLPSLLISSGSDGSLHAWQYTQ